MMETSIDVVANHCVIMSEDPCDSASLKHLINHNSPDRGPPKRGGPPHGARQVRRDRSYSKPNVTVYCVTKLY